MNNGDVLAATVGANGLSVVHQGSGGEASADSPDVCATTVGNSTVNIAYGNSAKSSDLADGSTTVTMDGGNSVALKGSTFSTSSGDEGGDKKGVSSGTIQGEAAFTSASPTVKIEGQGVARQSDSMTMNSGNTLCSGVNNPSFQIGTPEPETYSVNIYCENLANAPFKVKDGDGNIVASGELDGSGKCTLDPLPEDIRLEVEYEESSNEYNWGPGPVDFNQRYGELSDDAFFSLAAGSQYPFWLRKPNSRAEKYQWGILGCETYPNDTLQSIIELESKYLSPQMFTYWDAQEFAISLLKVMDKESMVQKDVRYFVSQLLCIASPNISTSLYADALYSFIWLDASTSYSELWANLRYFGRGNPQKAWDSLDWAAAAQHINKVSDAFFERFLSRLECVKGNASLAGYSEVEKVTLGHIDTVKRVRKQLIDETQTLLDNTKAKIQGIIDKGGDKPPVVKRPNQIVASAYDLNDKLYTQAPKLDKPKMESESWEPVSNISLPLEIYHTKRMFDDYSVDDLQSADLSMKEILKLGSIYNFALNIHEFAYPASWHFKVLRTASEATSWGEYSSIVRGMLDRFEENSGEKYTNLLLNKAMSEHSTTLNFTKDIYSVVKDNVASGDVIISNLEAKVKNHLNELSVLPKFNDFDWLNGLGAAVHDVYAVKVILIKLEFKGEEIRGTLSYLIQDHFGLDRPDIDGSKGFEFLAPYRSWFLLQRYKDYGYKPFITEMEFTHDF